MPDFRFRDALQGADILSISLISGAVWVVLAAVVALLPMRLQWIPGLALVIAAPVLLAWIAVDHGWWWFVLGGFAFVSMFRRPLGCLARRALASKEETPA